MPSLLTYRIHKVNPFGAEFCNNALQTTETRIAVKAVNRMTRLGCATYERVA